MKEVKWCDRGGLSYSDFVLELVKIVTKLVLVVFIMLRFIFDVQIFQSWLVAKVFRYLCVTLQTWLILKVITILL